ncbi:phosphoglycerate dehydrogenase [Lautropia mirabilis]|jgi:phosphoglycerate dehydrogenase|uniref:D-3-phosphoglycerate dehydrogenase n=1 Tax=Lautropia mirabilis ATCC 51599 TaxID=887898 RepID=E7RVE9_9BURK|nr:phosphoglycerate dehydrogenase [Lautropia mirabilis]RKW34774.1 MAG: phosphoglycerate dehydrogenase [Lautropia sp.]EFV95753.1 putative phosphoglycerate dehydrogenase [Lautropia mirabilis ATCC 51599]MBF1238139.1 phosphoglycerate dehydrogenase [Lautropia mirabilis]MDC6093121.1 phosphoglycerate dehydrogenase [Lautropia mirabilis]VEH02781.1 D-3-phosphoglycerate dehydrogenase [Lautropia mirabilis]
MGQARYHWAIRRVVSKEESVRLSLERNKLKVVLLEGIHPSAVEAFTADGYTQIETHPKALEGQALIDAIADAHFVGLRSRTQLTAEVLEQAQKLVAVGAFCIGTNQIALDAAAKRGVPVFNAPFSNTRSVAELVLAEIIMLMRGIPQKNALLHRGGWMKSAANSFEVRGKTLGIIGYGHIGTQLGLLAETLGMRVVFYDIETKLPLGNARQLSTLDELLAEADVVSLHVPETPDTKNMMGAEQIARMKKGSFLINASRGTVVDIDALAAALESKHILGAAIDVFPVEPKGNEGDFQSPLIRFENVLLTPHIGGSTGEAQESIGREVASKLIRYSNNGSTLSAVNFPEVSLPAHPGLCRILHIHRNVPGMLTRINERLSNAGINIASQYLQTNQHVGYVVVDVENEGSAEALHEISDLEGTIRARVLY